MKVRVLMVLLVLTAATVALAGDVQVICEPGLRVYLDGKFVGDTSAKEDGLFLAGVPVGAHIVRVDKPGFVPQSFKVEALKTPIEVKVGGFVLEPKQQQGAAPAAAPVKESMGNIVVTSAPQNCVVEVDGKAQTKEIPVLLVENLTPGEHTVAFSKQGYDRISGTVKVVSGIDVGVRGDLFEGKVEPVHEGKGSFRVVSTPDHISVLFRGKVEETWVSRYNYTFVPAGEYPVKVAWRGYEMKTRVTIIGGQRTILQVSFVKGDPPFVVSYEPE